MRSLLLMILALIAIQIGIACATTGTGGGVTWPKLAHCVPSAGELMGTVQRILLSDGTSGTTVGSRAQNELEKLAIDNGPATVACLVDEVIRDWTRPGAAANEERAAATTRGRSFLTGIGTEIHRDEGPPEP